MLYIMESLSPGEHIIQPTGYHWMYVFQKVVFLIMCCLLALALVMVGVVYREYPNLPPWFIPKAIGHISIGKLLGGFWSANIVIRIMAFMLVFMGLMQIGVAMIIRATTEMAVTNRRLIFKQGIIARHVNELKIENIEGINVNQTVMGRLFNYGQLSAHGTGVGEIYFPGYTADPVSFRRAIQSARTVVTPEDQVVMHDMHVTHHDDPTARELAQAVSRRSHGRGGSVDI